MLLPGAAYSFGSRLYPNARAMIDAGLGIVLATDFNPGSSPTPSMPMILSIAATHMKMTPAESITASTINAAYSLGLGAEIGSLEPGKRADLITLRLDRPHALPLYNVYSQIVYALKGSDVEDVMINGKPIVHEGRSLTLDEKLILAKAKEYGAKVAASLK